MNRNSKPIIGNTQNALHIVSLAAIQQFAEAVFSLSIDPMDALKKYRDLLRSLCSAGREDEALDWLCLVYGLLGIEYADTLALLRGHAAETGAFLSEYIANIDELIAEMSES
jgi:hypothetical protein